MPEWSHEYIGTDRPYLDGEREMLLHLLEKLPYYDSSGNCFLFRDAEGHCIVWFSKRRVALEVGADIRARFTVKSHREYNGVRENIVKSFRIL